MIEHGLKKLQDLQNKYSITIVCEPKLGLNRSRIGIDALHQFPIEIWDKYGVKICIDIGDYLLATGEQAIAYIKRWSKYIKVVHLHNVEFQGDKYIWVPVHPSHEFDYTHFKVEDIIIQLAKKSDIFFVFEHTPHSNPEEVFIKEGIDWVKSLLEKK